MSKASPQPQEKFVIRFPDGMRDRIAEAAAASGRSMNAEIVHRLQGSFASRLPEPASLYYEASGTKSVLKDAIAKLDRQRDETGERSPFGDSNSDAALYDGWKMFIERQVGAIDDLTQFISEAGGVDKVSSEDIQRKAEDLKIHLVPSLRKTP